jgi:hypothetical protein
MQDKETGRQGDKEMRLEPESPCLPLSLSPCLFRHCSRLLFARI